MLNLCRTIIFSLVVGVVSGMSESTGPQTLNFISKHRWRTGSCGPRLYGVRLKIHEPDHNGEGEVRMCVCVRVIILAEGIVYYTQCV